MAEERICNVSLSSVDVTSAGKIKEGRRKRKRGREGDYNFSLLCSVLSPLPSFPDEHDDDDDDDDPALEGKVLI